MSVLRLTVGNGSCLGSPSTICWKLREAQAAYRREGRDAVRSANVSNLQEQLMFQSVLANNLRTRTRRIVNWDKEHPCQSLDWKVDQLVWAVKHLEAGDTLPTPWQSGSSDTICIMLRAPIIVSFSFAGLGSPSLPSV